MRGILLQLLLESRVHVICRGRPPHLVPLAMRRGTGEERSARAKEKKRKKNGREPARSGDCVHRHPAHAAGAVRGGEKKKKAKASHHAYDEAFTPPSEESVRRGEGKREAGEESGACFPLEPSSCRSSSTSSPEGGKERCSYLLVYPLPLRGSRGD